MHQSRLDRVGNTDQTHRGLPINPIKERSKLYLIKPKPEKEMRTRRTAPKSIWKSQHNRFTRNKRSILRSKLFTTKRIDSISFSSLLLPWKIQREITVRRERDFLGSHIYIFLGSTVSHCSISLSLFTHGNKTIRFDIDWRLGPGVERWRIS